MRTFFWISYVVFLLIQGYITHRFIRTKNKLYLRSVLFSNVLFGLYLIADAVFDIGVPYFIRFLGITALFIHTFFGYFKDRYTRSKVFDRFLHVFGTTAFTLLLYEILVGLIKPDVHPRGFNVLFVFVLGIAIGALFEIVEFFIDLKAPVKSQRDLKDTDVDLICDVIGSSIAALAVLLFIL
jgi:uncharacterized membrane protein YjdF